MFVMAIDICLLDGRGEMKEKMIRDAEMLIRSAEILRCHAEILRCHAEIPRCEDLLLQNPWLEKKMAFESLFVERLSNVCHGH